MAAAGGAMLYYDDAKLENGEYQRCYLYATIYGVRYAAIYVC